MQNGATTSGIDVALVAIGTVGGSIAGTLTSVSNAVPYGSAWCAQVAVYDAGGHFVRATDFSRTGFQWGPYTIDALSPGAYYVRFENPACSSKYGSVGGRTPDVTFGSVPCITVDCDVRRGTPVVVSAGETTRGTDFAVPDGGSIAFDTGGRSPYEVRTDAELYDARGVRVSSSRILLRRDTLGLPAGTPAYVGLPDGVYYGRTPDGRLHPNVTCRDCPATAGEPIVIRNHSIASMQLSSPPTSYTVSGMVRDADTLAPLSTVTVEAYTAAGALVASAVTDATGRYDLSPVYNALGAVTGAYFLRTRNSRGYADRLYAAAACAGCEPSIGTPVPVAAADVGGVDFWLPRGGIVLTATTDASGVALSGQTVAFFDATGQKVAREPVGTTGLVNAQLQPGRYYARTEPVSGYVMTAYGAGACARGACDPAIGTPIDVTVATPVSLSIPVAACTPGDFSPSILASAVTGRAFRQVFSPSTPSTRVYVSGGRLPAGLTLEATTGVLSGTPAESGVFPFSVASVDPAGCALVREYTLHVARCAFTLAPDTATVGAAGGAVTVTASDVCGYSTVTSQASWITADAASASASTPLTLTVEPNPQAAVRVGTVTVGSRAFTVRQSGQVSSAPYGAYETPADGAQVSGSVPVTGWTLDDVQVSRVAIYRDAVAGEPGGTQVYLGDATFVPGARPDVEAAYPGVPDNTRAGWGYLLLTNMLPGGGNGGFRIYAFAEDTDGRSTLLGFRSITAANSTGTVPFGAIDTPGQGATVSGSRYINWGWALTPQPKLIPADGSTIGVVIDGVSVGPLTEHNLFRADVATLFPGLKNSGGPVGYRAIDTTALGEGLHTIAWVVTDDAGKATGIGSRYFTVRNSASAPSLESASALPPPASTRSENGLPDRATGVPPRIDGTDIGRRSASLASLPVDPDGVRTLALGPLQRLQLALSTEDAVCAPRYEGYLAANGELRALPIGSSLDPKGTFAWQPGPGFRGTYHLLFVRTSCDGARERIPVIVRIR